jgi:murein DD-endopeptidase MepM/ murein hydrolase activator NlpD
VTRRQRENKGLPASFSIALALGVLALAGSGCALLGGPRTQHPTTPPVVARETIDVHVHLRAGDSLAKILGAQGVAPADQRPWFVALGTAYDLRRLRAGRGLTLQLDRATRRLLSVRYEVDDRTLLVAELKGDRVVAEQRSLPYFVEVKGIAVHIQDGFKADTARAGLPPAVVVQLADIFAWERDLEAGLEPGDEFRVLYENLWETGAEQPYPGKILGAELVTGGGSTVALLFENEHGIGGYYRPDGTPVTRSLLRYPVEFTEITSGYSLSRFHPILHRRRPHRGVDFAAPQGTPVRAAADGRVIESDWEGGLGRTVRIGHAGSLRSTYGHLSRIAPGIRPGKRVERGQVIGYVGATGLATGPHLHYEIEVNGQHVDPLKVATTTPSAGKRLEPRRWSAFSRQANRVLQQLASLPQSRRPLTVSQASW